MQRDRDVLADALRGYALMAILWNHFAKTAIDAGFAGAQSLTLTQLGLSSAAELFVFLSGYVYAIAYGRAWDRHGAWAAIRKTARRIGDLLAANALLLVLCSLVVVVLFSGLREPGPEVSVFLNFANNLWPPLENVPWQFLLMVRGDSYVGILHLYGTLLLVAPLLLWALRRDLWLASAIAVAPWLAVQFGYLDQSLTGQAPYEFNRAAWLLLFFIGMLSGQKRLLRLAPGARVMWLLAAFLVATTIWKFGSPTGARIVLGSEANAIFPDPPMRDKNDMGLLRLVHALALIAFIAGLWHRLPALAQGWIDRVLGWFGRRSLTVYAASCVAIYLMAAVPTVFWPGSRTAYLAAYFAGPGLVALMTWAWMTAFGTAKARPQPVPVR
jgi:hypothetical protein